MTATSAWAVVNGGGRILVNTVRSNRTACSPPVAAARW